ncbi:MAG: sigma-70 family RNA polymerase sigma factor [Acidimicrobiia bacterium]|nr:sigma-70 family RNA polymerase sigma factor [Acidimicrobiia bacterium]MDH4308855.1 sigma-70 family RNA polymerase sigma factor [Acidimicrobiia bacterium]MDH5292784.1 sigma-70 family RNA polymerase sigma factor [Acidimicrobiia bacterium]MDH5521414.1 sigma-70 family RNA polymerase sigma factor [Acidimicrobiia bacterium]
MAPLTTEQQNTLVTETLDLVGHIVSEVSARYPRHVDRSELWNAGALGLVEASRRYDQDSGIPFARYAAIRIRGAIIDSTRTRDWASRSVRRRLREIQDVHTGLEEQSGRPPSSTEIAGFLGISVDELHSRQAHAATSTLLHLDQPSEGDETSLADRVEEERGDILPDIALEQRELRGSLVDAVRNLPAVQAEVISRYYLEGELLQDIADDLGLTEARVSQIRSEALLAMRSFFATQYEGVEAAPENAPGKRARAAYVARMSEQSTWRSRLDAEPMLETATLGEARLYD